MRVILYARVSTDEQVRSGHSIDAQAAKLRAWAELFDHDVVDVITDAGESAKSLNRLGIQKALSILGEAHAAGIVVAKLDGLTRNIADWQKLISHYFGEKAGRELFSLGDSIDTTTAGGRLVLNVLLSVAQWEREAIGERTRAAPSSTSFQLTRGPVKCDTAGTYSTTVRRLCPTNLSRRLSR